jgi:hypothetical protein
MLSYSKSWSRYWVDANGQHWYCSMVDVTRDSVQEFWLPIDMNSVRAGSSVPYMNEHVWHIGHACQYILSRTLRGLL